MANVRLADYVASFVVDIGVGEVFGVVGAGAMYLNDAFGNQPGLDFIATQHEQGASMAAEGYARVNGNIGVAQVTTGPGGTNALTGVCGAWIDSIPMMVISGQITINNMIGTSGLRQFGVQELDTIAIVSPVTKYAVCVMEPDQIRYHLEKAVYLAKSGRPGPVWIDIPLDVQNAQIDPDALGGYTPERPTRNPGEDYLEKKVDQVAAMLKSAERPVLYCGYGVHLAGAVDGFRKLAEKLGVPVISSWNASDLLATDHECYIGRCGILGDRAGNFTVQNADLILVIGTRMSLPQTGYNFSMFAREAKLVVVDIDEKEIVKPSLRTDLGVVADAGAFIDLLSTKLGNGRTPLAAEKWLVACHDLKRRYPVVLDEYRENAEGVNSYVFIDELADRLNNEAIVVTDMGTAFTCTMQAFATKQGQRLFTSSGLAAMGYGLPAAIGACYGGGGNRVICLAGDGGLQMSVMELQTLRQYDLPVTLFVLDNNGYMSIRWTQQKHFGRDVGAGPDSGQSCPDFVKVAEAYGLAAMRISDQKELAAGLDAALAAKGPLVCVIDMPEMQELIPRVSTDQRPDGTLVAKPLEDMYPFLDRDEFRKNMFVTPVND